MLTALPDGVGRCCRILTPKTGKVCGTKFPIELRVLNGPRLVPTKLCARHRGYQTKYVQNNPDRVKATKKAQRQKPGYKDAQAQRRATPEGKAARKREAKKARDSGDHAKRNRKYCAKPAVKERISARQSSNEGRKKRQDAHKKRMRDPGYRLMFNLETKVRKMLKKSDYESKTARSVAGMPQNVQLRAHIENTFPPGGSMTWANYGKLSSSEFSWELGHVIARSMYDGSKSDDVKRCWSLSNLFAQNASENHRLKVKLPADDVLLSIRECWPLYWNDVLPDANRRNALERAASRGLQPPAV